MGTIVKAMWARSASAAGSAADSNVLIPSVVDMDIPRQNVVAALAQESMPHLAESIRTYARRARANGDSVQEVLEVLMNLVPDATPDTTSLARRSCEVADCAIAAYFGEPEPTPARKWPAKPISRRSSRSQGATESSSRESYPFAR